MMIESYPKFRKKRGSVKQNSAPPSLVMVSASYSDSPAFVELVFDRAVDVAAFNPTTIAVSDFDFNNLSYVGSGSAVMLDSVTVKIDLSSVGPATGLGIRLNASAESGIVAADDAGTWPGVSDYALADP